jgi:hypothetical protein
LKKVLSNIPHQMLVLGVLVGFGCWVLVPLTLPKAATGLGVSDTTMRSVLELTIQVLSVVFILVMARVALSPVHEPRHDQPPLRVVTASFGPAPLRRPRLASNSELLRSSFRQMMRRPDSFNEVRAELNKVYQTNPELALELYREWATSRGMSTVPVVTKYGVLGRMIKAAWSQLFATKALHWLHELALVTKRVLVTITNPIVIPPTVLGTRLAFIARPWGGSRMSRLRHNDTVPRGAFVLDLAPILVLAAITALSMGATVTLQSF